MVELESWVRKETPLLAIKFDGNPTEMEAIRTAIEVAIDDPELTIEITHMFSSELTFSKIVNGNVTYVFVVNKDEYFILDQDGKYFSMAPQFWEPFFRPGSIQP